MQILALFAWLVAVPCGLPLALATPPATLETDNGMDRGGGGDLPQEWRNLGRDILAVLHRSNPANIDIARLERVILGAVIREWTPPRRWRRSRHSSDIRPRLLLLVDRCSYHPELARFADCRERVAPSSRVRPPRHDRRRFIRIPVTAINTPTRGTVVVDPIAWGDPRLTYEKKLNLALHEFGSLAGIDRNYETSYYFWRQLRLDRNTQDFRAQAVLLLTRQRDHFHARLTPDLRSIEIILGFARHSPDYEACTVTPEDSLREMSASDTHACRDRVAEATRPFPINESLVTPKICACIRFSVNFQQSLQRSGQVLIGQDPTQLESQSELDSAFERFRQSTSAVIDETVARSRIDLVDRVWLNRIESQFSLFRRTDFGRVRAPDGFVNLANAHCRQADTLGSSVSCGLDYLEHLVRNVFPSELQQGRIDLDAQFQRDLAEIETYTEIAPALTRPLTWSDASTVIPELSAPPSSPSVP